MKKNLTSVLFLCFAISSSAQKIVSINPYAIPASGTFTITIRGHNTFFLSHAVSFAQLTQPNNSDGSIFTSTSETVIDDETMTATFTVSNPVHGGYYNVSVTASGIYINAKTDGVYMTGIEPRLINSINPNYGIANTLLTAHITGSEMHFLSSTGFPHIGSVQLTSEIDNSTVTNTNVTYNDSNNVDVDFNIPYNATNGKYKLNIDLQNLNQTNRTHFFTVVGGVPKKIISLNPYKSIKNDSVQMIVKVSGRNLITNPVYSATLTSELTSYTLNIPYANIFLIDSNHVRLRMFISMNVPDGDYALTLNGNPALTKHFAFRVVPPNISGTIYLDTDSNGVKNGFDYGIGGRKVLLLPDSIIAITNNDGYFYYYVDSGNYTVQYLPDEFTLTSTPSSYAVFVDDIPQTGFDFGTHCTICNEHDFYVWHHDMRCDYTGFSYWEIHNITNAVQQGSLTLVHSNNLPVTLLQIAPTSVNGDTVVWNYTVNPNQTLHCNVQYQNPHAGDTVWYSYVDQIYNFQLRDTFGFVIRCSCDPNDKSVFPSEDSLHPVTLNSEELTYNINFQNTGTDTAFLVTINDTISPFLDLASFEIVGSSNLMVTNIDYPNRIVTFAFDNILLPDSNIDEPGSHGFVRYKIHALQGIPDSSTVTNTAYIYFDFNPYVETNTVASHLVYYLQPQASFTTASPAICMLSCIDFSSTSTNATSWQWTFSGGNPSTSTDENPHGICFFTSGSYDVTLIASNGFSADTITLANYLAVNPLPPPPTIYQINDTLYCTYDPLYTAYQWYDTTGLIVGATDSFYVPPFSGLFGISVYNQYGCDAASSLPIILNVEEAMDYNFSVFPNPANEKLFIRSKLLTDDAVIEITNVLGEKMLIMQLQKTLAKSEIEIDVRDFSSGIYFVRFQNQNKTIEKRFVKN